MGKWGMWILAAILLAAMVGLSGMARSLGEASPALPPSYDSLLRFHVIANSDTAEDQAVKRQVRDRLLEMLTPVLSRAKTPAEARELVLARQEEVSSAAQEVVRRAGKDYGVKVEVGRFIFPTKVYGDTALPAGRYDALRVSLGAAEGQNWWCVLFPPLCLVDAAGGVAVASPGFEGALAEVQDGQEGPARQGDPPSVEVRYALVEWLKRQPLTPRLESWLKARGWAVTPAAWRAAPPAPSPGAPHPGDRPEETPGR